MASYNPPTENLPIFDNAVFLSSSSTSTGLTETEANLLYLRKTYADTATALETFSAGINTSSVDTSTYVPLNIGASSSGVYIGNSGKNISNYINGPLTFNNSTGNNAMTLQTIGTIGYIDTNTELFLGYNTGLINFGGSSTVINTYGTLNGLNTINANIFDTPNASSTFTLLPSLTSGTLQIGTQSSLSNTINLGNAQSSITLGNLQITGTQIENRTATTNQIGIGNQQTGAGAILNIGTSGTRSGAINIGTGASATCSIGLGNINATSNIYLYSPSFTQKLLTATANLATNTVDSITATTLNIGTTTSNLVQIGKATFNTAILGTASTAGLLTATANLATNSIDSITTTTLNIGTATSNLVQIGRSTFNTAILGTASAAGLLTATANLATNTVDSITTTTLNIGTATSNLVQIGRSTFNTAILGTASTAGLLTTNGGLTIGGSNNITLGSGSTAPTSAQLGYTVFTTCTTAFSIAGSTGIQKTITPLTLTLPYIGGTWFVQFQLCYTTDSGTTTYSIFRSYMTATNQATGGPATFGRNSTTANGISSGATTNVSTSGSAVIQGNSTAAMVISVIADNTYTTTGTNNIYGDANKTTYLSATRIA